MPLRKPLSAAARVCTGLAFLLLAACGSDAGTSSGSAPDPATPIAVPDSPAARVPIDSHVWSDGEPDALLVSDSSHHRLLAFRR